MGIFGLFILVLVGEVTLVLLSQPVTSVACGFLLLSKIRQEFDLSVEVRTLVFVNYEAFILNVYLY